jgi:putative PIN family toxin of toxin-antitoxin system
VPALRVVLDTNVLLSGIAYPGSVPGKLIAAWRHGALDIVLSAYILNELRCVLPKLAHRHGLGANEIDDLVDVLSIQAELVEPEVVDEPELADMNDQPVLGTLIAALHGAQAEMLITGDRALLALSDRYPICNPAEFWAAQKNHEDNDVSSIDYTSR